MDTVVLVLFVASIVVTAIQAISCHFRTFVRK